MVFLIENWGYCYENTLRCVYVIYSKFLCEKKSMVKILVNVLKFEIQSVLIIESNYLTLGILSKIFETLYCPIDAPVVPKHCYLWCVRVLIFNENELKERCVSSMMFQVSYSVWSQISFVEVLRGFRINFNLLFSKV